VSMNQMAEADLEFTLEGLGEDITLTSTSTAVYHVKGPFNRIGIMIDQETGLQVVGPQSSGSVRLSRFPLNDLPADGWRFSCTDITGQTVSGVIHSVRLDRSMGVATFNVRAK
jgi:hypothetical protein